MTVVLTVVDGHRTRLCSVFLYDPEGDAKGGARRRPTGSGYNEGTAAPGDSDAERIERVMTTETGCKISEEPLAERVLRQVRSGKLDESRLLPSAEKRTRDVGKKLDRLAVRSGLVHLHGRPGVRGGDRQSALEAERRGHGGGAGHALAGRRCRGSRRTGWRSSDELIADALNNPAPVQKAEQ